MTESDAQAREDRRMHLELIQSVINRMSAASSNAKTWLLPVVTAAYGYALTQGADSVSTLGVGATLLCAYIDAQYLRQERKFRSVYNDVASGRSEIEPFSLSRIPSALETADIESSRWQKALSSWLCTLVPEFRIWISWSIMMFYLPIVIVGIGIALHVR